MAAKLVRRIVLSASCATGAFGAACRGYTADRALKEGVLVTDDSKFSHAATIAREAVVGFAVCAVSWPFTPLPSAKLNLSFTDMALSDLMEDKIYNAFLPNLFPNREQVGCRPNALVTRRFEGDTRVHLKFHPTRSDIMNALRNRGEDEIAVLCGDSAVIDPKQLESGVSLKNVMK